jgi:hypothetical protein
MVAQDPTVIWTEGVVGGKPTFVLVDLGNTHNLMF